MLPRPSESSGSRLTTPFRPVRGDQRTTKSRFDLGDEPLELVNLVHLALSPGLLLVQTPEGDSLPPLLRLSSGSVGAALCSEHILRGLIDEGDGVAAQALAHLE